jgi:hypothetical protein
MMIVLEDDQRLTQQPPNRSETGGDCQNNGELVKLALQC